MGTMRSDQVKCRHQFSKPTLPNTVARCIKCRVREDSWLRSQLEMALNDNVRLRRKAEKAADYAMMFTALGVQQPAAEAIRRNGGRIIFKQGSYIILPPHGSSHPSPGVLELPDGVLLEGSANFSHNTTVAELRVSRDKPQYTAYQVNDDDNDDDFDDVTDDDDDTDDEDDDEPSA